MDAIPGVTLELRSEDGVPLKATHYPSEGTTAAVIGHGFSSRQSNPKMIGLADSLARTGIDVFTFDFRGHGDSGGASALGAAEVADIQAVVAEAERAGFESIVSVGASMGGAVALRHAAEFKNVAGVVSISSPSGLHAAELARARAMSFFIRTKLGRSMMKRLNGTHLVPTDPLEPIVAAAPLVAPIPVVVIHGSVDPYIPIRDAHEIFSALREPKRLIELDGFGHAEAAFDVAFAGLLADVIHECVSQESSVE